MMMTKEVDVCADYRNEQEIEWAKEALRINDLLTIVPTWTAVMSETRKLKQYRSVRFGCQGICEEKIEFVVEK